MLKKHTNSNKKFIGKSAYAIAFVIPFISLFGETQASKITSGKNKFFIEKKHVDDYQLIHQFTMSRFMNCLKLTPIFKCKKLFKILVFLNYLF